MPGRRRAPARRGERDPPTRSDGVREYRPAPGGGEVVKTREESKRTERSERVACSYEVECLFLEISVWDQRFESPGAAARAWTACEVRIRRLPARWGLGRRSRSQLARAERSDRRGPLPATTLLLGGAREVAEHSLSYHRAQQKSDSVEPTQHSSLHSPAPNAKWPTLERSDPSTSMWIRWYSHSES
jgi:hypothetical protein